MRFKPVFQAPVLDLGAYKRHLNKYMEDWLKQAGREWLQATVGSIIPAWSNASRATFEKLAKLLDGDVKYGPQKSRKDRKPLGRAEGAGSKLILGKASWHFEYTSTLRYLAYNEYQKVTKSTPNVWAPDKIMGTPYHFLRVGQKAFQEFARHTTLPNPYKFMKKVKI